MPIRVPVSPKRKRGNPLPVLLATALLCTTLSRADDAPPPSLEAAERAVAADFASLEETLLKMARYLRKTEPERADLIVRALNRSREERLEVRLAAVADLLRSDAAAGLAPNFGDAIDEQQRLVAGMRSVLGLLRSEDRRDEIDSEQERLEALVKDLNRLIGDQRAAEAANRRGDSSDRVAGRQKDVTDRTGDLLDRVREADGKESGDTGDPDSENSEEKEGDPQEESEPGDPSAKPDDNNTDPQGGGGEKGREGEEGDPTDGEGGQDDPEDGDPADGEPQDGEQQPGGPSGETPRDGSPQQNDPQGGQPQDGDPQPGAPQPAGPQDSAPQPAEGTPPQTPGAEQIEEAQRAMREAQEQLEQAEREGAREKQAEAVRKLREAKEKLEEILRQLREEEAELTLRALEARFQKMLEDQQAVLAETERLAAATAGGDPADWEARYAAKARDLARRERLIGVEGDKAAGLLAEDGGSVAFPEALRQILADVSFAADLLGKPRVGELSQSVQRDVVASLEEMIAAFRQELEKLREQQQSGRPPGQGGQPGEEGLVDRIAELKMLRTLQVGVNRRTVLLGGEDPAGDASGDVDVARRLRDLAARQLRIERAAYDMATGRNR